MELCIRSAINTYLFSPMYTPFDYMSPVCISHPCVWPSMCISRRPTVCLSPPCVYPLSVYVSPCECTGVCMYRRVYVPSCGFLTLFISAACMCIPSVYMSPPSVYPTVYVSHRMYIPPCTCPSVCMSHRVYVPPYLCTVPPASMSLSLHECLLRVYAFHAHLVPRKT